MKILFTILSFLSMLQLNAQTYGTNSVDWGLNGNRILDRNFIGSTNSKPLVFKTNKITAGYFDTDQSLYLLNVPHTTILDSVLTIVNGQIRKVKYTGSGGGGSIDLQVLNGLHLDNDSIKLGGRLVQNTYINGLSPYDLKFKNFTVGHIDTMFYQANRYEVISHHTQMYSTSNTSIFAVTNQDADSTNRIAIEINGQANGGSNCQPNKETAIGIKMHGRSDCFYGVHLRGHSSAPSFTQAKDRIGLLLDGTHTGAIGITGTGIGLELRGSKSSSTGAGTDILITPTNGYLKIKEVISDYAVSLYGKNINGYVVNVSPLPHIANPTNDTEDRAAIIAILGVMRSVGLISPAP